MRIHLQAGRHLLVSTAFKNGMPCKYILECCCLNQPVRHHKHAASAKYCEQSMSHVEVRSWIAKSIHMHLVVLNVTSHSN